METLNAFLEKGSAAVWGAPLIILLFGTHLFLTFRLGLVQRYLPRAIRLSFSRKREGEGDISHFAALMTSLAATIGTGNIVGVATAVAAGGPGAVLWMWLTGVFGIATKYAEALLAVKYRVVSPTGEFSGGPMYVLERGLNAKWLGMLFAFFTAVAAFGIGNMVQANSISHLLNDTFGLSTWISGVVMTGLTAFVILGGIKSIARFCERLVPVMAVLYVLGCVLILLLNYDKVPGAISLILSSAFSGQAAVGGFLGAGAKEAMRYGIARG
ncbi:MAG: sodium:alanine symporter family protein, partial [Elusimicrobia bacterium CG08_land_8_20_14_0_20_59_10]